MRGNCISSIFTSRHHWKTESETKWSLIFKTLLNSEQLISFIMLGTFLGTISYSLLIFVQRWFHVSTQTYTCIKHFLNIKKKIVFLHANQEVWIGPRRKKARCAAGAKDSKFIGLSAISLLVSVGRKECEMYNKGKWLSYSHLIYIFIYNI